MHEEMDKWREMSKGSVHLVQEIITGGVNNVGNAIDPVLSERPIACVDGIANSGEDGGIVTGP